VLINKRIGEGLTGHQVDCHRCSLSRRCVYNLGMSSQYKISCRGLWKIFGPEPANVQRALKTGQSKEKVLEETGHVVAVKDVSFDVREGEIFVVMGLSGSGKSTLVRCMSRLIEPTDGSLSIDGTDVLGMDDKELLELRRHKMSMVFQHFGLFPHRRVIENIAFGLEVQGVDKETRLEKARQVLDMVGLTGWEQHYPHELSGGMQQRVGLARALAVDPEILLCDEPFSALDPLIRREMQDELINLQKVVRKTIIFITHDFLEAIKLGDHICIMKDGEFVQLGTPEEIVAHPLNDYVREFTKDVPRSKVLRARTIMKAFPVVVAANDDPEAILAQMREKQTTTAFVNGEGDRFLGVLSEADVAAALDRGQDDARSQMSSDVPVISPDTRLEALVPMTAASDGPIPVVDEAGELLGYVDRTSVMLALGS
jgi:glycine betaine/proline transport system ATP-binding protein